MTITIADGRGALWQWDTGRRVKIADGDGVNMYTPRRTRWRCRRSSVRSATLPT